MTEREHWPASETGRSRWCSSVLSLNQYTGTMISRSAETRNHLVWRGSEILELRFPREIAALENKILLEDFFETLQNMGSTFSEITCPPPSPDSSRELTFPEKCLPLAFGDCSWQGLAPPKSYPYWVSRGRVLPLECGDHLLTTGSLALSLLCFSESNGARLAGC